MAFFVREFAVEPVRVKMLIQASTPMMIWKDCSRDLGRAQRREPIANVRSFQRPIYVQRAE